MTGFTTPYGIASSSSNKPNEEAWRAFGDGGLWASNNQVSASLTYQFPFAKRVTGYIFNNKVGLTSIISYTFNGSNDGSSFTTLDTHATLTIGAGANYFTVITNINKYLYYRFTFTAGNNGLQVMGNCQMYGY